MKWNNELTQLCDVRMELYAQADQIQQLAIEAGMPAQYIDFNGPPAICWFNVLREAATRKKVDDLVKRVQEKHPEKHAALTVLLEQYQATKT
ncbi:MAG: effector-associated domain EAD1-containing protein [Chloroflexota bacterium]